MSCFLCTDNSYKSQTFSASYNDTCFFPTKRAAMQYMTQNPQLLSAIADDGSMPILSFIKKGHNEDGMNKRALWFTFVLVAAASLRLEQFIHLSNICMITYTIYFNLNFVVSVEILTTSHLLLQCVIY